MRICIFGAGAMGTSLGVLLQRAGYEVDFVTRNRTRVEELNGNGAYLTGLPEPIHETVTALAPQEMRGKYDLIFLATKQRDNAVTAVYLESFLRSDGALITVQNGLPEAEIAEVLGADRVYGCALSWGAEQEQGGAVKITGDDGFRMAIGAFGSGARLDEFVGILSKAGTVTAGDLTELRFAKLALNASFSTLSAISGLNFGTISKRYKKQALALMRETFSVAKSCGCKRLVQHGHDLMKLFGGAFAGILLPVAMKKYQYTRSGMLLDLRRGRRCDVDFVAGAVVRAGKERGVATPMMARAVALVHDIENGFAEIAPESILFLSEGICD